MELFVNIFCGKGYNYFFNEIFHSSNLRNKMIVLWIMKVYYPPKIVFTYQCQSGRPSLYQLCWGNGIYIKQRITNTLAEINRYKSVLEKIQFLINYGVIQIMGVVHIFVWLKYRISFGQGCAMYTIRCTGSSLYLT